MSLIKRYSNHSLVELIAIIDSGEDYTAEAKEAASTIIEFKAPSKEELTEAATIIWTEKIEENIREILKENSLPKSLFLSQNQMKEILRSKFEELKSRLELQKIDIQKYQAYFL